MKTSYSFILALIILLASCKGSTSPSPAWVVSTIAGSGAQGHQDGAAASAQFNDPYGVAVDSSGNVYVADIHNNRVRKITEEENDDGDKVWKVKTIASDGTNAQFHWPAGVAVDSSGNVYVADKNNHLIRKITKGADNAGDETWTVSTIAGDGTKGDLDGAAADARFNEPYGVALDKSGNVYVADLENHRIRKITKEVDNAGDETWTVSTIAGSTFGYKEDEDDEVTTTARFNWPAGVAVDSSGDVYVADVANNRVRKITEEENDDGDKVWKVSTLAGSGTQGHLDGAAATARFSWPYGVAVDKSDNVYAADYNTHRIRKITKEVDADGNKIWKVSTLAATARFNEPTGVAVDSSGNVYVADAKNHRIRKIEYRVP